MVHQKLTKSHNSWFLWPVGQAVKTAASHAVNVGSIPARVTKKLSLERGWAFSFVKNKYWNRRVWESKSLGRAGGSPRGAAVCQTETRVKPETAYRTNRPRGVGGPAPTGRKQKVNRQICWPNNGKMAVSVVYWNRKRQILKGTGGKFYENYFLWHAGV